MYVPVGLWDYKITSPGPYRNGWGQYPKSEKCESERINKNQCRVVETGTIKTFRKNSKRLFKNK